MSEDTAERLREICLSLPEAHEQLAWDDHVTWRVRSKIFAMPTESEGRPAFECKAPKGAQAFLVDAEPERFFVPRYVGRHGWIGMYVDRDVDWDEVREFIVESFVMTAPRRVAAQLGASEED